MKSNLFILLMFLCCSSFSQTPQFLVKFKATEEANPTFSKAWDFNYTEKKYPLNVEFDGKILNMFYDDGKVFDKIDVISFEKKERKAKDKFGVNYEAYILKVIQQGFDAYVILEKAISPNYTTNTVKIPYYDNFGEVKSYWYFQEFK